MFFFVSSCLRGKKLKGLIVKTIIVPVDGATNIKLEVLDYETLKTVYSQTTEIPSRRVNGLDYNCITDECLWFDSAIRAIPVAARNAVVIAPVARGASGGLIGSENTFIEVPGEGLTLAYTQKYPDDVDDRFCELAGSSEEFFLETGSIREFPGSITLMKRFVFEEMMRPETLNRAKCFGTFGVLLAGHFLGDDYLHAARTAGNEHSYWMCHTGTRNINKQPGTPSTISGKIGSFKKLVPAEPSMAYNAIGTMPSGQSTTLGLTEPPLVIPGGHDTCLSHIPIMSTFYQHFKNAMGTPVIHVEAGSWTMIAQIGGNVDLPPDGYKKDIIIQGTIDGEPVVTARYGGGNDFRHVKNLIEERGHHFGSDCNVGTDYNLSLRTEPLLEKTAREADCFVLPNISAVNHGTGPFPDLRGRIVNEKAFFSNPERALIIANLTSALTTSVQIDAVSRDTNLPLVITAGGAKDPYYGRLVASFTGRDVYALNDCDGSPLTETTTLGAAIVGKAASLRIHPYKIDVTSLGVVYQKMLPFDGEVNRQLMKYRELFMQEIVKEKKRA